MMAGFYAVIVSAILYPGILFSLLLGLGFEAVARKLEARMQSRVGPKYAGLRGLLQPLYDLLKLLGKEDLYPATGDGVVAGLALIWALSLSIMAVILLPWGYGGLGGFEGDAILVAAMLTLSLALLYIAAYASHSPYPLLGGLRLVGLLASYEAGIASLLAIGYAATGSLSLEAIRSGLWQGLLSRPLLFIPWLMAVVVGFALLIAEAGKDPFTIADAETEIAGGYEAEFSGRKLAFARLTHDVHVAASIVFYTSILLAPPPIHGVLAAVTLVALSFCVGFLVILVDAAAPRLRLRDAVRIGWGWLIPLAMISASMALALRGV